MHIRVHPDKWETCSRGLPGLNWEAVKHVTNPYEGFPSDRPMRDFHPCSYLAARPHLASSAHLYEHTHTYTPYMFAYMRVGEMFWYMEEGTEERGRGR